MLELNHIYNMDCMEGMKQIPDKYFELAIVDPPYGIGINSSGRLGHYGGKGKTWDVSVPDQAYFEELRRVSVNQIIWGGNYFNLPPVRCFVIWDKQQPENVSFAGCEYAWTSFDDSARIYRLRPQNLTEFGRIHPTQKPVTLYQWLLNKYAKQGDKILDTHMGSGSSIIACHDMGFEYMAFEIDKDYYDAAMKRIEEHKAQLRMVFK